jgi:hypothetical protein
VFEGWLAVDYYSEEIGTDGTLDDQGIYYYVAPNAIGRFSFKLSFLSCVHAKH